MAILFIMAAALGNLLFSFSRPFRAYQHHNYFSSVYYMQQSHCSSLKSSNAFKLECAFSHSIQPFQSSSF